MPENCPICRHVRELLAAPVGMPADSDPRAMAAAAVRLLKERDTLRAHVDVLHGHLGMSPMSGVHPASLAVAERRLKHMAAICEVSPHEPEEPEVA
jgi:hypothetical protein